MPTHRRALGLAGGILASLPILLWAACASAQDQLPWARRGEAPYPPPASDDTFASAPPRGDTYGGPAPRYGAPRAADDAYRPPAQPYETSRGYGSSYPPPRPDGYGQPYPAPAPGYGQPYPQQGYGDRYSGPPPGPAYEDPSGNGYGPPGQYGSYGPPPGGRPYDQGPGDTYSPSEVTDAGHRFFGGITQGLAKVIEYAFQSQGRPNGYILGQDAGGAFIAGLRYGEGTLHTKVTGAHRVYWQGPSIGYDAGVAGSKVMVLVYNLRDPYDIYQRFGGVDGSAYVVGGVGMTFQKSGNIVVAPIRAGVGLRLGANVGYLKYTQRPTWNPF